MKQLISEKRGFPVGEITLVTRQGAKQLKDEEVLAAEKRFLRLKMRVDVRGAA